MIRSFINFNESFSYISVKDKPVEEVVREVEEKLNQKGIEVESLTNTEDIGRINIANRLILEVWCCNHPNTVKGVATYRLFDQRPQSLHSRYITFSDGHYYTQHLGTIIKKIKEVLKGV